MTILFALFLLVIALSLLVLLVPVWQDNTMALSRRRTIIAVTALFFTAASLGIYAMVGSPQLIPLLEKRQQRINELAAEITDNLAKVKSDPKDLGAWVILGTAFLETGQLDSAVGAFKQAVVLSGGDPALILAYAKAQIMQADGKVTDDAKKGLEMVLMLQKDNPDARYFMALRKLQDGKTQEAMADMKALYHSLPDDSPVKSMINKQIGRE
jgi:cytochrome c-type biogenesis protein CcmH